MRVEKRVVLEDDDLELIYRLQEKIDFILKKDPDFYGDELLKEIKENLDYLLEL